MAIPLTTGSAYDVRLSRRCFDVLSTISSLTALVICFDDEMENWLGIAIAGEPVEPVTAVRRARAFGDAALCFSLFRNLCKLTILNIWGDLSQWRTAIVDILQQSPNLHSLTLSIGAITVESCQRRGDAWPRRQVPDRSYYRFFSDICEESQQRCLGRLRLRSLRLGEGIGFPRLSSLIKLVDSTTMQDVHIHNE